jgi:integrase
MPKPKQPDTARFKIGDYWLSKRPDARGDLWYRTWYDSAAKQTRRISLCTRDFEEAKVKLAEWILGGQNLTDEDPSTVPLATAFLRYWNEHGSKVRSHETIKMDLEKWKAFFGPIMVSELSKRRIKEFIQHLVEKGHSPGGINRILSDGRAALNRAKRESEVTSVPFIPSVPTEEPKERAISLEQMARIFDGVKSDHVFLFCLLAANSMARPEPLLELTRFQLDFESKLVKLNPEGRKQTKKYRPTVPMTDTLMPWLQKIKTNHVIQYHGHRIFSVRKAFQRMPAEIKGLPERVTPYSIRHTMAKELRRRGVSPWEIQGMLGHKAAGLRTTEIYAKYDPSYLSEARVAIDAIMAEIDSHMIKRRLILSDKPSIAIAGVE